MPQARTSEAAGAAEPALDDRRWTGVLLGLAAVAIALLAMPFVYGFVAFHGAWAKVSKPPAPLHILLNALANLLVMLSAIGFVGRLDRRLARVFTRTLVVHGTLAFGIIVTRQWYSIPILLMAVMSSAALGSLVVLMRQRHFVPQIGTIGPAHPITDDTRFRCTRIAHPDDPVQRFDLIVITAGSDLPAIWSPTVARALLGGKRVRHVSEFLEEASGAVTLEHFDLDHLPEGGLTSYRARKRLLDLLCVALIAPVALPALLLAGVGVFLTMGRPLFFVQPRVGQGGAVFRIIKLRTMRVLSTGEAGWATRPNDPRVTPLGRWLRRFRIDELPQLWNVVRGDMSFIGPRPEWTVLAAAFSAQEPAYDYRHLVRPGITGWAQVRTGAAADLAETRVKLGYDLFYIKHFSFALDLQILVRTLWTLLTGAGAR